MDNDGLNEPDDEEYMDNKDKAIKSAMKNETKAAPGELDNNWDEKEKLEHGSQYDNQPENQNEEIQKAMKETYNNVTKKPTKRLKDMGNVSSGVPSLGSLVSKYKK